MNKPAQPSKTARLICEHVLSECEGAEASRRAFTEQYGENGRKDGSLDQYLFLQSYYAGEMRLEKLGQLELFRKTQRLPDYRRAEDAVKRGWARFMELEFGIQPDQAKDKLKFRQHELLHGLRGVSTRVARQEILGQFSIVVGYAAKKKDDDFFRKLGHALDDAARKEDSDNDFAQVLLHHWLTGLWWLMPLSAVGAEIARIQGKPDAGDMIRKFNQRLRKIRTRKPEDASGKFFSQGWNGCFHSTHPPLIDCIEENGCPLLNATGRRLLR